MSRPLITEALDEAQLTTLRGNTHPLARREFDLGTAPASLPMERMLLVLKRNPERQLQRGHNCEQSFEDEHDGTHTAGAIEVCRLGYSPISPASQTTLADKGDLRLHIRRVVGFSRDSHKYS